MRDGVNFKKKLSNNGLSGIIKKKVSNLLLFFLMQVGKSCQFKIIFIFTIRQLLTV